MPEAAISTAARDETMDCLERERFDCVVIGGGISGAGVVREATQRGLSAALIEANDFSSGTSSRSSKLIHGGLRYLSMGDIGLVRSTALERKEIYRLAPHLSARRWMVVPTRSMAGLLKVLAGVTTYEKLGAVEREDRHRRWSTEEMAAEEPALDRRVFRHACVYREYLTDDSHLVLANLRAARGAGAAVLNHARVEKIVQQNGVATGVEAVCGLTGRRVCARARSVINASGPWVEAVRRLEDPAAPPLLHLSKGVHVVVRADRLPVNNMIVCNTPDRRSIFVIRTGEVVVLGTTDTTYRPGCELWPEITVEEVSYLLEPTSRYFDVDPLGPEDVVGAWAGLRPLIAEPGKEPQEISRRHEVLVGPARVITVAGGKLTGYRPMARRALEKAAEVCGLDPAPVPAEEPPLPGGDFDGALSALEEGLVREAGVSRSCAARVVRLHGTEAREIARGGRQPLVAGGPVLLAEVDWGVQVEGAATVEDVLYRRIRSPLYAPDTCQASVEPVASRMAALLGWDDGRTRAEVSRTRSRLEADLRFLE